MKKLLLLLVFLTSLLFSAECTEEEYKPFFVKNNDRYMFAISYNNGKSYSVIDKKSFKYDKNKQIIQAWIISQAFGDTEVGIMKSLYEIDIKNNKHRYIESILLRCDKSIISEDKDLEWNNIIPESYPEAISNIFKNYLNIK